MDFWKNLKVGYDAFELSRRVPRWDVCQRRYIFNHAGAALDPAGACPSATTAPELMAKVEAKQLEDEQALASRVAELESAAREKQEAEARRAAEAEEAALRTAKVNAAINARTGAVTSAVNGFFGSIFGAEQAQSAPGDSAVAATTGLSSGPPRPAPAGARPQ